MLDAYTRDILANWPGKSQQYAGQEHPAVYHMLDVAAVAECLLRSCEFPDPWKSSFAMLVGMHDLGKIGNSFRQMLRAGEKQTVKHWELTEAWLRGGDRNWYDIFGAENERVWEQVVGAIAGHHGRPSERMPRYFSRLCDQAGEEAKRDIPTVIAGFLALWPQATLRGLNRSEATLLSWQLSGLTVTADWIGSNIEWFPAQLPTLNFAEYLAQTRLRAEIAVRKAGLETAPLQSADLAGLFDFELRPMQQAARDIMLPAGPMLAFIEDETGAGKTEAALILAQRMLAAGKGQGLYVALPTMATADAMFARAQKILGKIFKTPSLTLAHGRAQLSNPFQDLVGRASLHREDEDDVTCAPWLADNRRRALLANIGIGTVDQVLLAVMPTRFSTLRIWGLASKILLIDEAHEIAGDHYMVTLLSALLRVHAAQGGSAIMLTATLPLQDRAALTQAFAEGLGQQLTADFDRSYPSLSIPGGAFRRDFDQSPGPKGIVRVTRLAAFDDAINLLTSAAGKGAACVWIRNAVDEAIHAAAELRARGVPVSLLHARFALCDRKAVEARELARFGRDGVGREGHVLIATQVVESSLDLDFDVMVSDLAPIAALIQRAGRLWRHMAIRPRDRRLGIEPVLHVLSPDPNVVLDASWLKPVLGQGSYVYPIADQWRTAKVLFDVGVIQSPAGLRDLIEAVRSPAEQLSLPIELENAELERQGLGYAQAALASGNLIDLQKGYREGAAGADDRTFPTRLGQLTRTLILARRRGGELVPWSPRSLNPHEDWMAWVLSEVQASQRRLTGLPLPDSTAPEIKSATQDWPEWKKEMTLCPVDENGFICDGLRYDETQGLLFE